ncbi:DUF2683 family protein [Candidatus Woesearchaeota archaeon]|nr:DUF2683 family protein [Candidatus Woesearchaeota archaeon]
MTQMRIELDEYTKRVLDVAKGKWGLKNRNQALSKFAREYGDELLDPPVNESILHEIDMIYKKHPKKRKMTLKELDKHLGL